MSECWGCSNFARTALFGFVQSGCAICFTREMARDPLVAKAQEIANSPVGKAWQRDPDALSAAIRSAVQTKADHTRLRNLVWAILKPQLETT